MINLRDNVGFTLIELVITLAIVGFVTAILLLSWPRFTIKLDAQAGLLADDIRYVQNLSMAKDERYRWVKVSSNSYQITNSSGTAVTLPSGNTTVTFNTGISFGTITNLPNNLIVFNSKGIPYTDTGNPGTLLNATAAITLTASGASKTVYISPETGWVTVQ
jgi:prepilin-type N-terminal cleavage/methylation domain-containing protein